MERFGTGRFVLVVGLILLTSRDSALSTSGVDNHHDYSGDVINAARCRVRCLSLLEVFASHSVVCFFFLQCFDTA